MNKSKLTTHRVTMPQDKALEYLDELLKMVNKQFLDPGFPIALSMAIDKMRTPSPENKALTVEELRGMTGQPVWIVAQPDWGHWELSECAEDYFEDRDEDFYGMTMPPTLPDPMGRYGLHMLGWLAYRRPPEKGE